MANAKSNKATANKAQSNRPSKTAPKGKTTAPARKVTKFFSFNSAHILRTHEFYNEEDEWVSTSFDVSFDDIITLYGCSVRYSEANDKCFICFPRKKGQDGKYWNEAWIALSDADHDAIVDAVLNDHEYVTNGFMDVDADEEIPFN